MKSLKMSNRAKRNTHILHTEKALTCVTCLKYFVEPMDLVMECDNCPKRFSVK